MVRTLLSPNDTRHITTERQILSSIITTEEAASLVKRFTKNTSGLSLRKAGSLIGVKAPTVQAMRDWQAAGADPTAASFAQKTLEGIQAYLRHADEIEARRAGLRIAADRLQALAGELRAEASRPDAGAIERAADAGEDEIRRRK